MIFRKDKMKTMKMSFLLTEMLFIKKDSRPQWKSMIGQRLMRTIIQREEDLALRTGTSRFSTIMMKVDIDKQ